MLHLHCLNNNTSNCSNRTVLERQRARIKWQQDQHQQQGYFSGTATGFNDVLSSSSLQLDNSQGSMRNMIAADSSTPPWSGFDDVNSVIPRTYSCPPTLVATAVVEAKHKDTDLAKINSSIGKESFKKRKANKPHNTTEVVAENDNKDKRIKVGSKDGESKSKVQTSIKDKTTSAKNNKSETCSDTSKENSKASDVQKPDYIHVRARRGQATDSHSLAERIRREKISERMKYLQDLVPSCNKITGKAGMLDEIINYVQSLQRQVETIVRKCIRCNYNVVMETTKSRGDPRFLSMKLAAVNSRLDFNMDDMFAKEMFPTCTPSYSTIGMSSDMTNPAYLQFNSQQQMVSSCGLDTVKNPPEVPMSIPETFIDSSCFNQILPSSTWEGDFQNLYNMAFEQARATPFPSQHFTGVVEASHLKMEIRPDLLLPF